MNDKRFIVEVCCESVYSTLVAQKCGAGRVEFCDNLAEGGTTPSMAQIVMAREQLAIDLYVIIRPRGGDFVYDDTEFAIMQDDIRMCGETGCDGVVIGMLHADGTVDKPRCAELVSIAKGYGMGVTFHRAFDVCADLDGALEEIIALGCDRILTSGGKAGAPEGVGELRRLIEKAAGRIIIMPGAGITPENAGEVIKATGCTQMHGTFRSKYGSTAYRPDWADYSVWHADPGKVSAVVETANLIHNNR